MDFDPNVMRWAYSTLTLKDVGDPADGMIEGMASTPTLDHQGDIMEPGGAEFTLPLPLLWHHDAKQPIGHVIAAKASDAGIAIKAKILRIKEPGRLKDRLDEAYQSIKHGLVRGLSIGFRGIEGEPIKGSVGLRFKKWRWIELSGVTVPANFEATIQVIKSLDSNEHLRVLPERERALVIAQLAQRRQATKHLPVVRLK